MGGWGERRKVGCVGWEVGGERRKVRCVGWEDGGERRKVGCRGWEVEVRGGRWDMDVDG